MMFSLNNLFLAWQLCHQPNRCAGKLIGWIGWFFEDFSVWPLRPELSRELAQIPTPDRLTLCHDVDLRLRGQARVVAVSGDERLHEVSIEILQRFPRSMTDTGIPFLQLRTDKSKPHVARHSHIRPQSRRGTARVLREKLFDLLF